MRALAKQINNFVEGARIKTLELLKWKKKHFINFPGKKPFVMREHE